MSEVEYLARKYRRHLGGVNYVKILKSLYETRSPLAEYLGVVGGERVEDELKRLECSRAKALADLYSEVERRLVDSIKEAKLVGVPRSDVRGAINKLREVRNRLRFYREMLKELCSQSLQVGSLPRQSS